MTQKEIELAIKNLQDNVHDLASRPYTERAEKASGEARKAQGDVQLVNDSVVDAEITMTDFMEEYYLAQLGLEVEEGE